MNLLRETLEKLTENNKTPADVRWAGSKDGRYAITWDAFVQLADIVYDDGFGGQEIADDLVVVGDDWWLERHEYDGSEWWEYKTLPVRQSDAQSFTWVRRNESWETRLAALQGQQAG